MSSFQNISYRIIPQNDPDIEQPNFTPEEYPYAKTIKGEDITAVAKANFVDPLPAPPTAAGDPNLFLDRQDFLLKRQYSNENKKIVSVIGNAILSALHKSENPNGISSIIDLKTAEDLGLMAKEGSVAHRMDRTKTYLGSLYHQMMIARPSPSFHHAINQQELIQFFIDDMNMRVQIQELLTEMGAVETAFFGLWDSKRQLPGSVGGMYCKLDPRINEICNNNSFLLDASAIGTTVQKTIGVGVKVLSGVLLTALAATETYRAFTNVDSPEELHDYADSYISSTPLGPLARIAMIPNIALMNATAAGIGGSMCLTSIRSSYEWLKADTGMLPLMQEVLSNVATYYRSMKAMHALIKQNPGLACKIEGFDKLDEFILNKKGVKELSDLFGLLESFSFNKGNKYFFRPGALLLVWELLHSGGEKKKKGKASKTEEVGGKQLPGDIIRNAFAEVLPVIGRIDTILSAVQLVVESKDSRVKYCIPKLSDKAVFPSLRIKGVWNPMVSTEAAVPNDFSIGEGKGVVITGPNAAGKSVFGRSIGLIPALIPYGVVPAEEAAVDGGVFGNLATSMNIKDSVTDGASLFASQAKLIGDIVDNLEKMPQGVSSFVVIDEAFIQTGSEDGKALLKATLQKIVAMPGVCCLGVTHFKEVAKELGKEGSYENYKMELKNKFVLTAGVSANEEGNAFEVARSQGVSEDILTAALSGRK